VYDALATVYEFLVPDELLEPEGAAAAFADVLDGEGPRVLDCAAGTGVLAVGLALRGFDVTASDASAEMIARARALAARRGAALTTAVRTWAALDGGPFDAVLCVGNSITHAAGRDARRAALAAMADVLAPGGLLVLTSRNWERVRARRSRLEVDDRVVERGGRRALVARAWFLPARWDEPHGLEVAVSLLGDDGAVTTHSELLAFWPSTHADLLDDVRAAGLEPEANTYEPDIDRYLVTARRPRSCT
jgi:SAM-dependent methyltransferase